MQIPILSSLHLSILKNLYELFIYSIADLCSSVDSISLDADLIKIVLKSVSRAITGYSAASSPIRIVPDGSVGSAKNAVRGAFGIGKIARDCFLYLEGEFAQHPDEIANDIFMIVDYSVPVSYPRPPRNPE